ncbi:4Fe-4S binding protein [Thermodesulfobacteriota bacterium]
METLRIWIQALSFFVVNGYWQFPATRTLYQGPLKAICSPGLNCYSCPAATTYCPIGSIQQLMAGLRMSLEAGQYYFGLYVVGSLGLLGSLFGRMICGWFCPFGLFQDLLNKIRSRKFNIPTPLKYIKYGVLLFMVILLPALAVDEYGAGTLWFCKYLCPAGTLEAGIPLLALKPNYTEIIGILFFCKLAILILYIFWSVLASRPFCRTTCPLGAFYALFHRAKLIKLRLDADKCTECKACHSVCPMGVKFNESPEDMECITCLKCMDQACSYQAISLEIGGIPLHVATGAPSSEPEIKT